MLRACAAALALFVLMSLPALRAAAAHDPWLALEQPWFDTVGMDDGLPLSATTALAEDRDGFLWIGTMGGLARYDGYHMRVFEQASATAKGLPDSYVRCLLVLPDGSLLVGTNAGGLTRFDPATIQFHDYPVGADGTRSRKIYALSPDGERGVWIATDNGLSYLDLRNDRIAPVRIDSGTTPHDFAVYQDRAGDVWLGNDKGLFVRYTGSDNFVRPTHPAGVIDRILHNGIWAIREDAEGQMWVGSEHMGTLYRDTDGHWHTVPSLDGDAGNGQQATVRDLLEATPNRMWIATDGDGIIAYRPGDAGVRVIAQDISQPSSLPGNTVRALLLGRAGNIWAATDLGVAHTRARGGVAFSLLPSANDAHTLSNPNVRSIHVDASGRVWLGLSAGKIDIIDPADATVRHLRLGGKQARRDVQSFAEAPDGSIWVGAQGIARIDPHTLAIKDSILPELDGAPVLTLLRQGPYMLIGTYIGAFRYDTRNRQLIHYGHVANQPDSLASDTVRQIVPVGTSIWYATNNGISIARNPLQTSGFVNLARREGDPHSLPHNLVDSIAVDTRGRVWVGTLGGLAMLPDGDAPPLRFQRFGTESGLVNDKINAVLPDDKGNLWASTSNGISVVDGKSLRIRNLGIRDGLHIVSYIYAAAARAPGDTLLFGGSGGLTVIQPSRYRANVVQAPLRITGVMADDQRLSLPDDGGTLALSAHQRRLRVGFALLDYQAQQQTDYSYRMEGFDSDWIDVSRGTKPSATYTNLPHGHYVLRLRAVPRGLHARVIESDLDITVAPQWYETLWALLLALVLALALIVLLVHLRTLYLRRNARLLQAQIDARTHELLAANRRLDMLAGTDELTGVNNRRRFLELAEQVRNDAGAQPACIALLDMDHFKRVNDEHGHLAGDAVLRTAAGVICQQLRSGDLVGRYGGEELVLCLPNSNSAQATAVAERIRSTMHRTLTRHDGHAIAITASIGIAELRPGESMTSWLSRADAALYESKHQGRNRCTLAG